MSGPELTTDVEALPRTGKGIVKVLAQGWAHRVLAARGPLARVRKELDGHGYVRNVRTYVEVDSVTLRLRHADGRAAVAVWIDGKFEAAFTWHVCRNTNCPRGTVDHPADTPRRLNARDLRALVTT